MNPAFKARMHSYLSAELHTAKQRLESTRRGYLDYGHYDDCGDYYNDEYREAQGVVTYLEKQKKRYTLTPIELKQLQERNLRKRKKR